MSTLCLGTNNDGTICDRSAARDTGFCASHKSQASRAVKAKLTTAQKLAQSVAEEERLKRMQERKDYELAVADVKDKIIAIKDLDSLREAEQSVMLGLIDGSIDPKAAGGITQLLKHQAELLTKTKPTETIGVQGRQNLIKLSTEMTPDQAWQLMQNFGLNFARLKTDTQRAIDVEAVEVPQIEMREDERESASVTGERAGETTDDTAADLTEVF